MAIESWRSETAVETPWPTVTILEPRGPAWARHYCQTLRQHRFTKWNGMSTSLLLLERTRVEEFSIVRTGLIGRFRQGPGSLLVAQLLRHLECNILSNLRQTR